MSTNPPNPYQDWSQPPAPRPGMGCGTKLLIALGISFLLLMVLCCGGGVVFMLSARHYMAEATSEDPETVRRMTREISEIEIPASFVPKASMDMKIPFVGQRFMTWVFYSDQASGSMIMLGEMGEVFGAQNQEQMRQSMEQAFRQQGRQHEDMTVNSTAEKQLEIRGKPATFTVAQGISNESKRPRIQVTGVFQGRNGLAMLILDVDAEKYPERQVLEILQSIK